ncbi:zinc finger protein 24-like isoform X3 [Pteropus alecto]|uniref:zinc finger protein 24-like isoform X3 n=1 Tax=Pteropus alecto TaxID=9402 RepID=UPI000D53A7DD|nr:zinc finger protein 24-like isoform X3 [Pteropus alecto]
METEGYSETQRNREVQNGQIMPPPNEMVAEELEDMLITAPQIQFPREPSRHPPESFDEDCMEDVEAMPRRNPPNPAASRQRFRKFRYEDAAGPREVLRHLQELAGQWLRPDIHTKEQIVEMLVQEQFQAVLPEEVILALWVQRPVLWLTVETSSIYDCERVNSSCFPSMTQSEEPFCLWLGSWICRSALIISTRDV